MLASGGSVSGSQFLAQSTINTMTTNQLAPGIHPDGTETGLGVFRLAYGAQPVVANDSVWGHQGGDAGVSACLLFSKVTRYGIVIVMNSPSDGQVCAFAQELYRTVYSAENYAQRGCRVLGRRRRS
jgi:CubicO group peptidase (beta-lactamase class C family)